MTKEEKNKVTTRYAPTTKTTGTVSLRYTPRPPTYTNITTSR